MTSIAIDGQNEEDFRRSIETDLRHGREQTAVERLRRLIAPYAGPDGILPARFASITAQDLSLRGWEYLEDCIKRHDRPGRPVTAIGISFAWPGEDAPLPDAEGRLSPHVETAYYNDSAYPFSQSGRDDLLDGYSFHGCTWSSDCEASDNALSVDGIDDLHGALAELEMRLLQSDEPDEEAICAGSLGSCLLSALLFQAVAQRVAADGLPRPLCVTAGSNGVYPYFDAPVVGMPENVRRAAELAEEEEADPLAGVPGPRYSSLLMTGIPRAQKRAVLVLAETESEMAVRIAKLRGNGEAGSPPEETYAPPPPVDEPVAIEPSAASPLLSKNPSQHSWDFRDMLGPRPAEPMPGPDPEPDPLPMPAPEPELPEDEQPPASSDDQPRAWFDANWDEDAARFALPDSIRDLVPEVQGEPEAELPPIDADWDDPIESDAPEPDPIAPEPAFDLADEVHPEPDPDPEIGAVPVTPIEPVLDLRIEDEVPAPRLARPVTFPREKTVPILPGLNDQLQERLESLLSPQVPLRFEAPHEEPALALDAAPDRAAEVSHSVVAEPWPIEAAGLAWPAGMFAGDAAPPAEPRLQGGDTAPAAVAPVSLLARLSAWLRRGR